eukprot:403336878
MREIKGEISDLMSKIENASKQIYDSFINQKHEVLLSAQKEIKQHQQQQQMLLSGSQNINFKETFQPMPQNIHAGASLSQPSQVSSQPQLNSLNKTFQQSINPGQVLGNNNRQAQINYQNLGINENPFYNHNRTFLNHPSSETLLDVNQQRLNTLSHQPQLQNCYQFQYNQPSLNPYTMTNTLDQHEYQSYQKLLQDYIVLKRQSDDQQLIIRDQSVLLQNKQDEIQNLIYEKQETRLKYELNIDQLTLQNKHLQQRVLHFQQQSEFQDILQIYNEQMTSLETQNKGLIVELRKLAKVQANEIKAQNSNNDNQKIDYLEKSLRTIKLAVKKLSSQLQKAHTQLEEFRKKERIFNLQKRCIDDSIKKANLYYRKFTQVSQNAQGLNLSKQTLSNDVQTLQTQNNQYHKHVLDLAQQVDMLIEENSLLKDFTYNVDQTSKVIHSQNYMNKSINERCGAGDFNDRSLINNSQNYQILNNLNQEQRLIDKINQYAKRSSLNFKEYERKL